MASNSISEDSQLPERYEASMVLHAVGDAMGYKNGKWEFKFSTEDIHDELNKLGGLEALVLDKKNWMVSDDTVLHLANAECLIKTKDKSPSSDVYIELIDYYKTAMSDMNGRAPGNTTMISVHKLSKHKPDGYKIDFNPRGGGCGASMRSSCIGLRYSKPEQINDLIEFSIESGRMTHHHPIGYLGGLAAALLTSYAIQDIPVNNWGAKCLKDLELTKVYMSKTDHFKQENLESWPSFITRWKDYLNKRNILTENNEPSFPENYGVKETDAFYKYLSNNNWPGACGLDSVLIAYDALLASKNDWKQLAMRAILHGGDNDSTGCIAGSWYGAINGYKGVPENNYKTVEYKERLQKCAIELYKIQYN